MKSKSQNLVLFFILFALNIVAQDKIYQKPITHLSFGSCNRAGLHPEVWKTIGLQQSDVWIWLGDIVYGKTADSKDLSQQYEIQNENPYYGEFKEKVKIFGVWDDHDFGKNDGGKDYALKDVS